MGTNVPCRHKNEITRLFYQSKIWAEIQEIKYMYSQDSYFSVLKYKINFLRCVENVYVDYIVIL